VVKVFLDSADLGEMREAARSKQLKGVTTNPTLMRKAGIKDYEAFAEMAVTAFPHLPLSLEVIADDFEHMERQARKVAGWGENIYVKIPVTNSKGESSVEVIRKLSGQGVKVNVTALFCFTQIQQVMDVLAVGCPAIISVFAGRIGDTGRIPNATICHAIRLKRSSLHEVLWASTRQVLDVYTADSLHCDIITVSKELFDKLPLEGKNLSTYSLETVQMFSRDAKAAGYTI
jgi:transaldolase